MSQPLIQLRLRKGHERRVRRGHPWIFSNELEPLEGDLPPGSIVRVVDSRDRFVGIGYGNLRSLITVRLLRRTEGPIDDDFLAGKIDGAIALRERLYPGEEALRLVYSDSDGLPGLVVDRYGDHLAVQCTTRGMELLLPRVTAILTERLDPRCIVARNDVHFRRLEGLSEGIEVLAGEPDQDLTVTYEGLRLDIDLMGGQKTGLYLDQRDNQRALAHLLGRGRVLDIFCYQGIWGMMALRAGADQVIGVDSSAAALAMAARHAESNGLADRVDWRRNDALETIKAFRGEGERFDAVVLDPPAFVKSRKQVKDGLRGYLDLNRKAFDLVADGGILITCSCSHHVRPEVFRDTIAHAASLSGCHARVLFAGTQSGDHPSLVTATETDYLKCLALYITR